MTELVSIVDRLSKKQYHSSVIATYNCDFTFYEGFVLRRLFSSECRNNVLLVDEGQIAETVAKGDFAPGSAGLDYTLLPARATGAFHPKFVLLVGEKRVDLFVGSHNVSLSGWSANEELSCHYSWHGEEWSPELGEIVAFTRSWTPNLPPELERQLDRALVPLEQRAPASPSERSGLFGSRPPGPALWEQVRTEVGESTRHIYVLSPYFDVHSNFVEKLVEDLQPERLTIATDPERGGVPHSLLHQDMVDLRWVAARSPHGKAGAFVHAKLLIVEHLDGRATTLTGSANASRPAWLGTPDSRNAELVVIDRYENLDELDEQLGCMSMFEGPPITEADLHATESLDEAPEGAVSGPVTQFVERDGTVQGTLSVESEVESAHALPGASEEMRCVQEGAKLVLHDVPDHVITVELQFADGHRGIGVIHRTRYVARVSRSRKEQALRDLFEDLAGGDVELEGLLEVLSGVIFDSNAGERPALVTGSQETDGSADAGEIDLGVDQTEADETVQLRRSTNDLFLLIDALLARLKLETELLDAPADDAALMGTDDESLLSNRREVSDVEAELARRARSKLDELVRRLRQRFEGDDLIVPQTMAVLGIACELAAREARFSEQRRSLAFVNSEALMDLLEICYATIFGPNAALHRDELTHVSELRGFTAWLLFSTGFHRPRASAEPTFRRLDREHRERRAAERELLQLLVEVFVEIGRDGAARSYLESLLTKTVSADDRPAAFAWLRDHAQWGELVVRKMSSPNPKAALEVGDLVVAKHAPTTPLVVAATRGSKVDVAGPVNGFGRKFVQLVCRHDELI